MTVEVYDGSLVKVAEIASVSGVSYSRSLAGRDSARWTIARSDPQIGLLSPDAGNVVTLAGGLWSGMVERIRGDDTGTVTVEARSFDAILDARYLPTDAVYGPSASAAFRSIIGTAGERNPHGIGVGSVGSVSGRFTGSLQASSARRALDTVTGYAGAEWWVDPVVSGSSLNHYAHLADRRGLDRYDEVALVHGAGVAVRQWVIDGQASAWSTTMVGGSSSPIQSVTDRDAAEAVAELGDVVHGRWRTKVNKGATFASRRERIKVAEELRDAGRVKEAARIAAARPEPMERVDVLVTDQTIWTAVGPGDVVRLIAPDAMLTGLDTGARIMAWEINEDLGEAALVVEILDGDQ